MNRFEKNLVNTIETVKDHIQTLNKQTGVVSNKQPYIPKQSTSNRTYALKQFISKQTYLEQKRNEIVKLREIAKETENETIITMIENVDEFMDTLTEESYKKKWHQLDNWQKRQKLIEYYTHLFEQNILTEEEKINSIQQITNETIKELRNKIVYDKKLGKIENIKI